MIKIHGEDPFFIRGKYIALKTTYRKLSTKYVSKVFLFIFDHVYAAQIRAIPFATPSSTFRRESVIFLA